MPATKLKTHNVCQICGKTKPRFELFHADMVRSSVVHEIEKDNLTWDSKGWICLSDLNRYRLKHIEALLKDEKKEMTDLEAQVISTMYQHDFLAKNINAESQQKRSLGEIIADGVAEFGGSWTFIISFMLILVVWIAFNSIHLLAQPFDPFPYILLNLMLSCLAAIQAPIIMMSQNRQNTRDRMRSEHDYQINLKAELEIRTLHEKIDKLMNNQWSRLLEIQETQLEMLKEIPQKTDA